MNRPTAMLVSVLVLLMVPAGSSVASTPGVAQQVVADAKAAAADDAQAVAARSAAASAKDPSKSAAFEKQAAADASAAQKQDLATALLLDKAASAVKADQKALQNQAAGFAAVAAENATWSAADNRAARTCAARSGGCAAGVNSAATAVATPTVGIVALTSPAAATSGLTAFDGSYKGTDTTSVGVSGGGQTYNKSMATPITFTVLNGQIKESPTLVIGNASPISTQGVAHASILTPYGPLSMTLDFTRAPGSRVVNVKGLFTGNFNVGNGSRVALKSDIQASRVTAPPVSNGTTPASNGSSISVAISTTTAQAFATTPEGAAGIETSLSAAAAPALAGAKPASLAVSAAFAAIGIPYHFGGKTAAEFDCSGLTRFAYQAAGRTPPLPEGAQAQFDDRSSANVDVAHGQSLEPGDLVFWGVGTTNTSRARNIKHVGIVASTNPTVVITAPGEGAAVHETTYHSPPLKWSSLIDKKTQLREYFIGARRP